MSEFKSAAIGFASHRHANIEYLVAGGAYEQPAGGLLIFTEYGVEPVTVSAGRTDSEFIRHLNFLNIMIHLDHLEVFQKGGQVSIFP